ncbi:hypothetical protein [Indioceanicola profundi]|uniref:hypothetical protein n=1 Tax=Indioceanicola profundi TaxID=2220096 RepID=UPI000E6AC43D|nr:hypothetical protein [Indioceanicola profundi]
MAGIMMSVTRAQFLEFRRHLTSVTKAGLRETYGISESTWRRMRDSQPIRVTTFTRLLARYERNLARADQGTMAVRYRRSHANAGHGAGLAA